MVITNPINKKAMQSTQITNRAPFSLYFKRDEFYLFQSNYKGLKEICFTDHPTDEMLRERDATCVVAVFKVKPKRNIVAA